MIKKFKTDKNIFAENANWKFSKDIVKSFDKHILKSVPMYLEGHKTICSISDYFLNDGSVVYDLGCSTGTLVFKLNKRHHRKKIKYYCVEIEHEMLKYAKKINKKKNVFFSNQDINKIKFKKSDLIISHYTIQFISPRIRQKIIDKIYKSLNWGGAFLFFEKVRGPDARFQDILTGVYNEFKLENGFKPEEIFNKTRSLKSILEPFSPNGNLGLLKRAGFKDIVTIQKSICFQGWLAIK